MDKLDLLVTRVVAMRDQYEAELRCTDTPRELTPRELQQLLVLISDCLTALAEEDDAL